MTWLELGIPVSLGGRARQRVACPKCSKGNRDDALSADLNTGRFHCFRCKWTGNVNDHDESAAQLVTRIDDPAVIERKRARLQRIWRESVPLNHADAKAVRSYLQNRGLGHAVAKHPLQCLRAHRGVEYWDGHARRSYGRYPAMVACVSGRDGSPVSLHITYLRWDGANKADVPAPKKIMPVPKWGATAGGAIRLMEPDRGVLGIAEGIETSLSLHLIRRIPVWSAMYAGNLTRIRLPTHLRELSIGVDFDRNGVGQEAAAALAERLHEHRPHVKVLLVEPELKNHEYGDLNDELLEQMHISTTTSGRTA